MARPGVTETSWLARRVFPGVLLLVFERVRPGLGLVRVP
jgi:hypothetical protein